MNSASAALLADPPAGQARSTLPAPEAPRPAVDRGWPVAILGVPFDHVTLRGALDRIEAMIASGRPHAVVTANVDFLVQAQRDVELRRILLEADLVLCDGTPLVWASRWLGNALPERVAGADLAPHLMGLAAQKGYRVFFLGAAPGVAAEAEARLLRQFPTLKIVGTYAPPFQHLLEMDHAEIVRRVRAARPDILLVSFGCPKQEKWIAMHHRALGVPAAIGVGATIDFLAGRVKRAPAWMRRCGAEWIFRLAQEPRRLLGRYATDLACFGPKLVAQACRLADDRGAATPARDVFIDTPGWRGVDAGARLTRAALEADPVFWTDVLGRATHGVIDLSKVRHIDATGIAFLIRWRNELLRRGRQPVLVAPARPVERALAALGLLDHFAVADSVAQATRPAALPLGAAAVEPAGTSPALAWCGEIIAANAEDVWQATTRHITACAARHVALVVIDLAAVRFIDSSGAALMLRLKKWSSRLHTEVLFTQPQRNVRNVLRLTRLDQLLLEGGQ